MFYKINENLQSKHIFKHNRLLSLFCTLFISNVEIAYQVYKLIKKEG